jgi:serine/threonine protein kinase
MSFESTFHTITNKPDKISRYEILEEIGRGSMGTVYSANDPFIGSKVAIKVAHPQYVDQSESGNRFRKLFFNEAHAASVLDHPSILTHYDADVDEKLCYLVMEYVPGAQTLGAFCKPDSLLPLRDVVGFIYKAAKALDYAHRNGIIHRDIKPSNILCTKEMDIRIADFSIAMIIRQDAKNTQFDGFIGSPLYMSPEQINEWKISSNTDIFSLGVVMYEMLTGHHPFVADSLSAISNKITNATPHGLSDFRKDIPDGLDHTLARMLIKNPDKRYSMGLDLAADLALLFEDLDKVDSEDALRKKFNTLSQLGFFKGFTDADIWELIRACNWENYPAGTIIIREGDLDNSFYVMLSGVVKVEKAGQYLDLLQEGDCFGEMGYLSRTKRTATIQAKTDVSLVKINESTLDRAAEDTQLRFLKVFVHTVIQRLAQTSATLAQLKSNIVSH